MKKIAIDAIDINSLGGIVHLQQLTTSLSKKKIFLKIYCNSFVKKNININKKIELIKKDIFDKNFIFRHLWKIFFLKKELYNDDCKLLIALNGVYHGLYKPTLLIQQNILPFEDYAKKKYDFFSNIKFFLQKFSILFSIKIHKNVIFTSFDIKSKILKSFKNIKSIKSKVIYHGVKKKIYIKKKIFSKDRNRFLFISEFQKYKNHENLFKAIQENKDINKSIKLTCIGRCYDTYLKELNLKYNFKKLKIKIIKNIPHNKILNIYNNYDAIIFPTSCESFGLPVIEAASHKVPILCSNLKVFREIYGKGCFYFDYQNYRSILKKINYFSSLKEKEIKKKIEINFKKAKKLNWEYCGNNYYQMIIDILNLYEKKN